MEETRGNSNSVIERGFDDATETCDDWDSVRFATEHTHTPRPECIAPKVEVVAVETGVGSARGESN